MGCCFLKPKKHIIETVTHKNSSSSNNIPYQKLEDEDPRVPNQLPSLEENRVDQRKVSHKPSNFEQKPLILLLNNNRIEERKLRKGNENHSTRKFLSSEFPKRTSPSKSTSDQNKNQQLLSIGRRQTKSNTLPPALGEQFSGILSTPLLNQIKPKWQRDATELPVATDLPRMVRNVMVRCNEGEILFERATTKGTARSSLSQLTLLKELFLTLARYFTLNELHANIILRWPEFFNEDEVAGTLDVTSQLRKFLLQVIGSQNVLINVLKGVNQSVISPAVLRIRTFFFGEYNLKDIHNAWDIDILFAKTGTIVVRHLKWEESIPSCFKLQWRLDLIFNQNATELLDTQLDVPALEFTDNIQTTEEQKVRGIVDDLLKLSPRALRPN